MGELIESKFENLGKLQKDLLKIKADVLLLGDDAMKDHADRCSHEHDSQGSLNNATPLSTPYQTTANLTP
jgi:hypothetical protein